MTSPTLLNREELLELAALDAFGLLDQYEAQLYTRSFHHAPAAVQDEILQLQAELAADESLLPDEQPPAELRQRVLDAVSRAMEEDATRLSPLASIGFQRLRNAGEGDRRENRGGAILFWRAAVFALAAGLLVVLLFLFQANQMNNRLVEIAVGNEALQSLEDLQLPGYRNFIRQPDNIEHRVLTAVGEAPSASVFVQINNETGNAYVTAIGLPETDSGFVLELKQDDGDVMSLGKLQITDKVARFGAAHIAELPVAVATTATWRITDATGTVLYSTT